MTKNKKNLIRICVTLALYAAALIIHNFIEMPLYAAVIMFAAVYLSAGWDVLWRAVKNIAHGRIFDENFLMTIATIGAFFIGEYADAVAVMLFYQTGELFQSYAVGKSRKSIADMMDIRPETAVVLRDGEEIVVHPSEIETGETLLVRPGEKIALDGVVTFGQSALDTSALTGESAPRTVSEGTEVISGSINLNGVIHVTAQKTYDDSTVSKILDLVENAASEKAPAENFITKFSRYYTPAVVAAALLLGVIPPLVDGQWAIWLKRAMMFLFVSCPCALVISVPMSFFGGIAAASKKGILVKGGNYLELLSKTKVFVFDKTGTLTEGRFAVRRVVPEENRDDILRTAAIAEKGSSHPIALSICAASPLPQTAEYTVTEIAGRGMRAARGSEVILCGNKNLMEENGIAYVEEKDGTVVYVAKNGKYAGAIVISDALKEGSAETMEALNGDGCRTVMLTGDNFSAAKEAAEKLGVTDFRAELLPADKVTEVEKLIKTKQKGENVAFCGDGINDAPVLMRADLGIAMGAMGSDAAVEAADIVLMYDTPESIPLAKNIAKKTMGIVFQNIVFALAVKFAVLALSAFGIVESMILAVFADVGVSVIAILNAMRAMYVGKNKQKNKEQLKT